jgi:predicted peroxiredoxin
MYFHWYEVRQHCADQFSKNEQIVSKSYQHFNQGRHKSNYKVDICKNEMKKQKTKEERIQDVVEVVSSNTFASIQQVSEDNLKEFLVSILCLCIQMKKSK